MAALLNPNLNHGRGKGLQWQLLQAFQSEAAMLQRTVEMSLKKGKRNDNQGNRSTYYSCTHIGCRKTYKAVHLLNYVAVENDNINSNYLEEDLSVVHEHGADEILPVRGNSS